MSLFDAVAFLYNACLGCMRLFLYCFVLSFAYLFPTFLGRIAVSGCGLSCIVGYRNIFFCFIAV